MAGYRRGATTLFRNPVRKAQRSVPGFSSTTTSACRRYATTACGYRERPQASHAVPTCGRRYAPKNAIDTV